MTALAGIWRFEDRPDLTHDCGAILAAQLQYGPDDQSVAALENAAFGRALFRLLPEDAFDAQPLANPAARHMLVADVRIDNRDEVLAGLGCGEGGSISDSELLFRAYEAWGERIFDRIIGDYAFALWDARRQLLILARDPAGQKPLHYHVGRGFAAFASMPRALHALDDVECAADYPQLAGFVADIPLQPSSTFFRNIARVPSGCLVRITRDGVKQESFWKLPDREIRFARQSEYVDAFREQLGRATRARLRRAGGGIGAHLSGGLDSGAVTATAATILRPEQKRVLALTSAPRQGFDGPLPRGRIGDESELAAATAAMHPNIDHLIVRPSGTSPLRSLGEDSRLFQEPVGLPCNQVWLSAVSEAAHARGVSVMLTGEVGNVTISAGGIGMLADFIRTGRWLRWWEAARGSAATDDVRWRAVLGASFGPWVPRRIWNLLTRLHSGYGGGGVGVSFLQDQWRQAVASSARENARGGRPEKDNRQSRLKLLQGQDMGAFRKGVLARWKIDERDPTSDRRLAEFCFALPPDQLIGGGRTRRLARLALADRLPVEVLNGRRGYQHADWYEALSEDALRSELEVLGGSAQASSLLDLDRLRELVAQWPTEGWETQPVVTTFRLGLLRALSAARFAERACQ
jgi:asparagine synthase (glutamine-hydrolysing)